MLNELGKEIAEINIANGWDAITLADWEDKHKVPAIIALIHSEASEALEDFREANLDHFGEECADIIIRVLDLTAGLEIDIEKEIMTKLEKNKHRGYKHGGKRI